MAQTSKTPYNLIPLPTSIQPNEQGFLGEYGGQFIPPDLKLALDKVAKVFEDAKNDPVFIKELASLYQHFVGRPSPLFTCHNLSKYLATATGGATIVLKREDLNHLGAHKVNNTIGQILIAKRMNKTHIIAETGAGQHGVATAATAALMGMRCTIYMGEEDIKRQALNVTRMQMLGATVITAKSGQRTLKEAVDEALGAYHKDLDNSFYLLGSAVGPHPYPAMVSYFQSIIGQEARGQMLETHGTLPNACIACVGGGSNAIGLFSHFIEDASVRLIGVEPGGIGVGYGEHAASLSLGKPGTIHGFHSYMLQDEKGEAASVYSISAGLDYPSVGPQHSYLKDLGRTTYTHVSDTEALDAFFMLAQKEGILPALESAHALAHAIALAPTMPKEAILLVCLSGRGDKDVEQIQALVESKHYVPKNMGA